ncbi:response regulator transcription factor [Portibacter marinus]|uniref:response regulator transcription factor n=1 Tax=Portibacter marinus TaxID=2898660 RepID=UPI001F290BDF|nr:helix-turn-helix transcriptional regulator [Portibacter marinus]
MKPLTKLGFIITLLLPSILGHTQYQIKGQFLDSEHKYSRIILQYVPSLTQLSRLDMNNYVNVAAVDSQGYFTLNGNDIPLEPMVYQLMLSSGKNHNSIFSGRSKNYIQVVLDRNTRMIIYDCMDISSTFAGCNVEGSIESHLLQKFADEFLPSIKSKTNVQGEMDSELKDQFAYRYHSDAIKKYMDTSQFQIPALYAYHHLKDAEFEIKSDPNFFRNFLSRMESLNGASRYYLEAKIEIQSILELVNLDDEEAKLDPTIIIFITLSIIIIVLGFLTIYYRVKWKNLLKDKGELDMDELLHSVTEKEQEIIELILAGHSNKEIASQLFVSLSTVKTHITNIYAKLHVSSRKQLKRLLASVSQDKWPHK